MLGCGVGMSGEKWVGFGGINGAVATGGFWRASIWWISDVLPDGVSALAAVGNVSGVEEEAVAMAGEAVPAKLANGS